MHRTLLSIAFILLGYSQRGVAIKCWECNSKYDPNCDDPFKSHTLALSDCSQRHLEQDQMAEATICRKLTQKIMGETRVVRSCGYLNPHEAGTCQYRAGTHMVFSDYCACAGDGCNRAGHPLASPPRLWLLVGILLLALLRAMS